MANTEYKKKLYDGLKSEGWISVDENKFYESLSDPKYVDKLYNGLKSEGWVSVDYDKFSQSLTSGGGDMGKQQGSTEPSEQSQDTTTTPSSETPLEQVEKPINEDTQGSIIIGDKYYSPNGVAAEPEYS